MDSQKVIDQYLERTGQTYQDLMGGLHDYGFTEVIALADKANKENKKITWVQDFENIDGSSFILEDI